MVEKGTGAGHAYRARGFNSMAGTHGRFKGRNQPGRKKKKHMFQEVVSGG